MLTTDRNTFSGLLGITDGTNYHQLCTDSDGTTLNLYRGNPGAQTSLLALSTNTWYFAALTCAGTGAGQLIGYARAITSNSFTTVSAAGISFTPNAVNWGRDGFTGEYITGRIHACGMAGAVLSADELLELSYYHEPQLDGIRSVNVFYPCIESANSNATVDRSGNGRNATATVGALADSPPLLWRPIPPYMVMPAAAASGAITGASTLTFSPTGVLTGSGALTGASTLTFSPTSTIQGFAPITGASTLTFAPAGVLTGSGALVGGTTLTFSPTAALTGDGSLTGSATITFSPSGTIEDAAGGAGAISGQSSLTFTVMGVLSGAGDLAGSTTLTFSPSGLLTDASAPVVVEQPVTGGGFYYAFEYHRALREKRKRLEREREEAEREIQDETDRNIAQLLHEQEAKDAERDELQRIQRMADEYAGRAMQEGVSRRAAAAILKAQEERSFNALMQMQREIERMFEEEEVAIKAALMLDDD